jgi:hypothetical protein
MFDFVIQHQFWAAVVIYWIFSAAVSSMPDPNANGSSGYLWLYRFLHTTAGNITTAFGSKIPGVKSMVFLLALPLLLSTSACAATHYTVHPGALNQADSVTYDTLLIAETAIDDARADYQAGRLPGNTKSAFDTLVRCYNLAHQSWLTYRGAIAANLPAAAYFNELNQNLTDLTNALRAFSESEANASPTGRKEAQ